VSPDDVERNVERQGLALDVAATMGLQDPQKISRSGRWEWTGDDWL